jgi:hypothetical protein
MAKNHNCERLLDCLDDWDKAFFEAAIFFEVGQLEVDDVLLLGEIPMCTHDNLNKFLQMQIEWYRRLKLHHPKQFTMGRTPEGSGTIRRTA